MSNMIVPNLPTLTDENAREPQLQQYLTFILNGDAYAISILMVKEIIEYGAVTAVPMTPAHIRGIINLRGSVVPVINLAARFGQTSQTPTKRSCIVIVEIISAGEKIDIGIVVDAVNEVVDIPDSKIEPAPDFGTKICSDYIYGMGSINEEFVIVIDIGCTLLIEDLANFNNSVARNFKGVSSEVLFSYINSYLENPTKHSQ